MKRIFQPAILLMNQLRYTRKFMVLGLIFLIAIIEVIYGLSVNLGPIIRTSQRELEGLALIKPLSGTIRLLQQHRGLTSGVLGGNNEMKHARALKSDEIVASLALLEKQLSVDMPMSANWKSIKAGWGDIQKDSLNWALDKNFLSHTLLIEQLQQLKMQIADQYSLTSDPDIDAHYLIETSLVDLPVVLEHLGQIRGLGTGLLAQKKISESQKYKMHAGIVELRSALKSLTINLDKTILLNPGIKTTLTVTSSSINASSQQLIALVESDILSTNFSTSPDDFFMRVTTDIESGNQQLHQTLLPTTESLLNARIQQAKNEITLRVGTAMLLLLLSYYLFISIYFSTIDSINSLASSAKKIADGDLNERIALNTRDELGLIGDSFNEMAIGFNALMVTRLEDEVRLRAILDGALDASVQMDAKGNVIGWSAQAQNIFGWSSDEIMGQALHDFIIPLRYREAHQRGLQHFLASGEGPVLKSRIEVEGLHREGHEFPIELAISPVKTAGAFEFNAFIRDITKRKNNEAASRIAAIAFETMDGIIITDANNIILNVNQAFTQITGYRTEDVIGKSPSILNSGRHDAAFYQQMWASLKQDKFWFGEVWNRRKSGEVFPERLRITAVINDHGDIINYVAAFSDITEQKKSEDAINALAFFDPLTHLPNRRLMLDRLQQMLNASDHSEQYGAILSLDLDNFKSLNDTMGHDIGDLLLIEVTKRLYTCTHTEDTVSRIGGDEFVILLDALSTEGLQAATQVEAVAERIRIALSLPFDLQGHTYHSSSSIGICLFRDHELAVDELFKRADSAMHQAKHAGRNTIRFFDPATQAALESRVLLESWLRNAIPEQFRLFYQPQVDDSGRILGAEALIRWLHPDNGLISPAMFIPLAEETGLILPIGDWVMETACQQIKTWEDHPEMRHLQIAVNVSAKQFQQQDFVIKVLSVLDRTGADPARLKLELTESLLVDDVETIIEKMVELKTRGVTFSLDDFGTGFSSLSYLKRLPLNQLKIDQSFVRNLLNDANDEAIVRTIIALGHSMGLAVIAEGVETKAQRDFLHAHGCLHYQGYLFGKPLELQSFENLLQQT